MNSGPDDPAAAFEAATQNLPATTEAERLTIQRIGQNIFRDRLMTHWQGRCPLTGITDPALLRASHIKPWRYCDTTAERMDVFNGLLLSALWDAAFDKGLVTFDDQGVPIFSHHRSYAACSALQWVGPSSWTAPTKTGWFGIAKRISTADDEPDDHDRIAPGTSAAARRESPDGLRGILVTQVARGRHMTLCRRSYGRVVAAA
jgi:hypothetical protein